MTDPAISFLHSRPGQILLATGCVTFLIIVHAYFNRYTAVNDNGPGVIVIDHFSGQAYQIFNKADPFGGNKASISH